MTTDGDQPGGAHRPDPADLRPPQIDDAVTPRAAWFWVQLIGLGLLAAGVAVLVVFALTLGGR